MEVDFDPKTFVMVSGEQIIDGKSYTFDEKGVGTLKQDKWNQLLETYEKDTSTNQLMSDVEINQKSRLQRQVVLGHGRTLKKGGSSPFFRCFDNLVAQ